MLAKFVPRPRQKIDEQKIDANSQIVVSPSLQISFDLRLRCQPEDLQFSPEQMAAKFCLRTSRLLPARKSRIFIF